MAIPTAKVKAYAQAIMSHVKTGAQLESWQSFLDTLIELFQSHNQVMQRWVSTQHLTLQQKADFLSAKVIDKKNDLKKRFIYLMLRDDLTSSLAELKKQLQKIYDDKHQRGALEIVSQHPVSQEQESKIIAQFQKHFPDKKFYVVQTPTEEQGVVARFRDYVLDLRASSRLKQMINQLLKG